MPEYLDDEDMPGGRDRWLLSYADLLTLLLAFFVVMYSVSAVNETKLAELSSSIASSFNQEHVEQDISQPETSPPSDLPFDVVDGLAGESLVSLPGALLFESGSAELKPGADAALKTLMSILANSEGPIVVEGHTDNLPVSGQFPSNWELSGSRASAAVRYLVAHDFDKGRFKAVGLADTAPIDENDTVEGRSNNRRVVFRVNQVNWQAVNIQSTDMDSEKSNSTSDAQPNDVEEPISIDNIDPELLEQLLRDIEAGGH